ncbi:hypothetical protein HD806DRAFT_543490 [Xylariaceae sp. AK1471]|nr:hypothetical protein HD806DRAFT_543490 [Xylariaceae sp. AK1471]
MSSHESPSSGATENRTSTKNTLDSIGFKRPSMEYPGTDMNGQRSSDESTEIDPSRNDSDPSYEALNPTASLEVSGPFMSMPAASISIEPSHQAVDPEMSGYGVSSPTGHGDAVAITPNNPGSHHSASNSSIKDDLPVSPTSTQITELPDTSGCLDPMSTNPQLASPLPVLESLGFSGLACLIGGHIGILGVLAFLTFLWFGFGSAPEAANASWAWRQIALLNWMTRAITLSSLAIRLFVTLQTTVCTSMIAALILEKRSARKSYIPWFSVIRSINDGPRRLVQMLLTSKSLTIGYYPEFWLAVLMVLTTIALQFSSTVLLSDLHSRMIVGDYNHTQVPGLITYNKEDFGIRLVSFEYLLKHPIFSTFGEVPSSIDISPDGHGVSDTGLLQRGFLPFSESQNRTSARRYDGNAMVMSSRGTCMKPIIQGRYAYVRGGQGGSGNSEGNGVLEGQLQYTSSFQQAQVDAVSLCNAVNCKEPFECSLPSSAYGDTQSGACQLNNFGRGPQYLSLKPHWNPSDGEAPWSANSSAYLVFATNMRDTDWSQTVEPASLSEGQPYQEWQSYEILPGRFLNLTLCFVGVGLDRKSVKMNSSVDRHEPLMSRSIISKKYDTADVRKLFGVDGIRRSAAERGTLDMMIIGESEDGPASSRAYETITVRDVSNITIARFTTAVLELVFNAQSVQVIGDNGTLPFCSACSIAAEVLLDTNLSMVLNDIITQSGRAANALLTYFTIIASAVYYDYLGALVDFQEAGTILTTVVQVPGQCTEYTCQGFISVATLLGAHLLYVTVITILYTRQIRFSRYGNIWHATSQLVSAESKEVWEQSNNVSDKAITKAWDKESKNYFLSLSRLDVSGQIGFLKTSVPTASQPELDLASPSRLARLARLKDKLRWKGWKNKEEV